MSLNKEAKLNLKVPTVNKYNNLEKGKEPLYQPAMG